MSDSLYTLAYFSRNAIENQDLAALTREIEAILDVARASNKARGITGALLYSRGCFAQVLEGPLEHVEATFERIQLDPRHHDITVLQFQPLEGRSFGDWSMAFAGIDPDAPESARIDAVLADPDQIEAAKEGSEFVATLRSLIARRETYKV